MPITNWAELEASPFKAAFTVGAEAANAIITQVTLTGRQGQIIDKPLAVPYYLSSSAAGIGQSAAPSGAVASANSIGSVINTDKVHGLAVTNNRGRLDVSITESGALTLYLVLVLPTGQLAISPAITFEA